MASEKKCNNDQVETTIREYPVDGSMQEKVDFYVQLKEKKSQLEAKVKSINDVLSHIQDELLVWLEQNPTDRLHSSDNKYVSATERIYFSELQSDLQKFKKFMGDKWFEFEGFNTKRINALIKDYKGMSVKLMTPLEDLLPAGLVVSKKSYLTVRKAVTKGQKESTFDIMSLINSNEGEE
jgi:hypothetical protein